MDDHDGDSSHIQGAHLSTVPFGDDILYMPVPLDAVQGVQ
jgi:hypothetical protein